LNTFRPVDGEDVEYEHPLRDTDWGHSPDPVAALPAEADISCDFCSANSVVGAWVPGKLIWVTAVDQLHDYSTPWAVCETCNRYVKNRSVHLLLDRAVAQLPKAGAEGGGFSRAERQRLRRELKSLYRAFFRAQPVGPLPIGKA
jgi:hypothetical protein